MTIAKRKNYQGFIGSDFSFLLSFPYDISGFEFKSEVRDKKTNALLAAFAVEVDAGNDTVLFTLSDVITDAIEAGAYNYDLKQKDATGGDIVLMYGTMRFVESITARW